MSQGLGGQARWMQLEKQQIIVDVRVRDGEGKEIRVMDYGWYNQ